MKVLAVAAILAAVGFVAPAHSQIVLRPPSVTVIPNGDAREDANRREQDRQRYEHRRLEEQRRDENLKYRGNDHSSINTGIVPVDYYDHRYDRRYERRYQPRCHWWNGRCHYY